MFFLSFGDIPQVLIISSEDLDEIIFSLKNFDEQSEIYSVS